MSTQNSNPPHRVPPYRRPIVVSSFLLLLAIVIIITILIFKNLQPSDPTPAAPAAPTTSEPTTDQPVSEPIDEPDTKPSPYEGEDPNLRNDLTGRVSYKNIDYGSNQLIVSVSIDQYLVSGGTCHLELLNDDIVLASLDLPASPDISTSVCGPFNLPIVGIPQGTYQLKILLTSDDRQGTIIDQISI